MVDSRPDSRPPDAHPDAHPDARPERAQTDESLAIERAKADDALAKVAIVERTADAIVAEARGQADEILTTAREMADEKLAKAASDGQGLVAIEQRRSSEDHVIEAERAAADAALRMEREASARIIARLLPIERNKTDRYLLTERARADDALANRDDFLGMVAHDLRDLLGGIVMNTTLLMEQTKQDSSEEDRADTAQRIHRSAARMTRLIGDLVDVAGIDAGRLAMNSTAADPFQLVAEAVQTWGPAALVKEITLEAIGDSPAISASFDHERLLQVLGNLITNAIKFSERGASVGVGVQAGADEVRFFVKDTGAGIPADRQEMVFERFWQLGRNDRRGLGLGLFISKCLVEAHTGKIWVESEPGAGSTFYFTIPC